VVSSPVSQASPRSNFLLIRSALVAALGGLLFGFDTAVISGTTRALSQVYGLSPGMLGFTVSIALWGTVFGAILASRPADRYGRRAALHCLAVFYLVSALGCAFAPSYIWLVVFRFIGGLGVGASSVVGPMYIAEIAPAAKRGRLVGLFQANVVSGILLAYLSNYLVGLAHTGPAEWRWKLGVAAIPALVFFFALFSIPQSPRWLVRVGRREEARDVLKRIGEPDVDRHIADIVESVTTERVGGSEPLFQRKYRLPIFLALSMGIFNQFTGINAILYYVNDIFERAGYSKVSSDQQAVVIGLTFFVFTLVAMSAIDRLGRKKLLLLGALGCGFSLAGVAAIFATGQHWGWLLWLLVGFIAFFSLSQGTVIWVYLSEVCPTLVRAKGQSLGSFSHWFTDAAISGIFPLMAASSGAAPFALFSVMTLAQFVVVLMFYPETKGLTLEQMQKRVLR